MNSIINSIHFQNQFFCTSFWIERTANSPNQKLQIHKVQHWIPLHLQWLQLTPKSKSIFAFFFFSLKFISLFNCGGIQNKKKNTNQFSILVACCKLIFLIFFRFLRSFQKEKIRICVSDFHFSFPFSFIFFQLACLI